MKYDNEDSYSLGRVVKQGNVTAEFIASIVAGDFAFAVTPEVLGNSAAEINIDGYVQTIECKLVNGDGDVVRAFNGTMPITLTTVTAGDGTATIEGPTVTMVEGVGTVEITYADTFAADDTVTLTLGDTTTLAGVSIANKNVVDTIIA